MLKAWPETEITQALSSFPTTGQRLSGAAGVGSPEGGRGHLAGSGGVAKPDPSGSVVVFGNEQHLDPVFFSLHLAHLRGVTVIPSQGHIQSGWKLYGRSTKERLRGIEWCLFPVCPGCTEGPQHPGAGFCPTVGTREKPVVEKFASPCLLLHLPTKFPPGGLGCNWVIAEHLSLVSLFQFVFLIWEDFTRISKTEMSRSHRPLLKKNL